jgi:hypothetical protein
MAFFRTLPNKTSDHFHMFSLEEEKRVKPARFKEGDAESEPNKKQKSVRNQIYFISKGEVIRSDNK